MNTADEKFVKLDVEKFEKLKNQNPEERLSSNFVEGHNFYQLNEYDNTGRIIKTTTIDYTGKATVKQSIDEYFDYYEIYYTNGNIKNKRVFSWLGFGIGTEYSFNDVGKIISTKDWDEGFTFDFHDLLNYLKKSGIDILKKTGIPNEILKDLSHDQKKWIVRSLNPSGKFIDIYVIDGKTGDLIEKTEEKYTSRLNEL